MAMSLSFGQIVTVILCVAAIIGGVLFVAQLGQTKEALKEIPSPLIEKQLSVKVTPSEAQEGTNFVLIAEYSYNKEQQDLVLELRNGDYSQLVVMYDDGKHYDSSARDGIYGGIFDSSNKLRGKYDVISNGEILASFSTYRAGCEPIIGNYGDDKINIVVVPEGYNDYSEFKSDVKNLFLGEGSLLTIEPLKTNRNKFSFSAPQTNRSLECKIGCYGVPAIICCNNRIVYEEASRCSYDNILVLVKNDGLCGSAADYSKICSKNRLSNLAIVHEFGHSFADLADEYTYSTAYGSYNIGKINSANCAEQGCNKWKNLTEGCYPGCTYDSLFRPAEEESIMYTYFPVFNVVCENQIEKIINDYRRVKSGADRALPRENKSYLVTLQYNQGSVEIETVYTKPVPASVNVKSSNYAANIRDEFGKSIFSTELYMPIIMRPLPGSETTAVEQNDFEVSVLLPYYPRGDSIEITRNNITVARRSLAPFSETCGDRICQRTENHVSCSEDCTINDGFCETSKCDPDCPSQKSCLSARNLKYTFGIGMVAAGVLIIIFVLTRAAKPK